MPLVRIDLRKGKDAAHRQDIGRTVCEALVNVGVPKNDRFQVVGEYEAEDSSSIPTTSALIGACDRFIVRLSRRRTLPMPG
jgi:hypothetical protein